MKPKLFQKSQKHEKKKKFLSIGEKPQLLVKEILLSANYRQTYAM